MKNHIDILKFYRLYTLYLYLIVIKTQREKKIGGKLNAFSVYNC